MPLGKGESVRVIKSLEDKGASAVVKLDNKVRNTGLVEGDHDFDCKVDGIGAMQLKSEFVNKVWGIRPGS
jgi:protein PhnA